MHADNPESQANLETLIHTLNASEATSSLTDKIEALTQLGNLLQTENNPRGLFFLLELLKSGTNTQLLIHSIGVLSRLQAYSAVMLLIDITLASRIKYFENQSDQHRNSDDSLRLRCAAAQALGRMSDERAIIPLMSLLNDKKENYRLRLAAAESLGKLGDAHAVTPLLSIINDEAEKSVYLKESAAKALGMLGDIRALEPLIEVLESKRGFLNKFNFLKEQIIESIGRIGSNHGGPSKVIQSLKKALKDEVASIRLAAVEALTEIGDTEFLDTLYPMLLDSDEDVSNATVSALFRLGGEQAIQKALQMTNLPDMIRDELESYIP